MLGAKFDPWFLEMSPYHPKHYGAFPEYLFHHERGFEKDAGVRWETPHLSLPQGLSLDRVLDRVSLRNQLESQSDALAAAADDGFDKYREAAVSLLGVPFELWSLMLFLLLGGLMGLLARRAMD